MSFFICKDCGYGSASWLGRCPNCNEWNTFSEQKNLFDKAEENIQDFVATPLNKIQSHNKEKKKTGIFELDRVLGDGLTPGAVILLTGEPGIGKSTLLLQSLPQLKTIYISGEEAAEQVKNRAQRLKIRLTDFLFSDVLQVEAIVSGIEKMDEKPDVIVIDSIQTIYSNAVESSQGSVAQLKETAIQLIKLAKEYDITIILIGHVTKEGDIAGPKTLEHMVDCVISFEGEKVSQYRILRAEKNRFGTTDEIGIFEMGEQGLHQISNPLIFLGHDKQAVAGRAIVAVAEGKRSLFFEIQALAVSTSLAVPRRVVKGVDYNKVLLLLAVIRKHLRLPLDTYDLYVNVVGGVGVKSTSADLGITAALYSSLTDIPISDKTVFTGEVGLLGEIRKGYLEEKIITEAKRLKFEKVISSQTTKNIKSIKNIIVP